MGKAIRSGSHTMSRDMVRQEEAPNVKKKRSGVAKSRTGCKTCKYVFYLKSS